MTPNSLRCFEVSRRASAARGLVSSFAVFQISYFPALFVLGPVVAKRDLGGAGAWGAILACQSAGADLR